MKITRYASFITKRKGEISVVNLVVSRISITRVNRPKQKTTLSCHWQWNLAFDDSLCVCDGLRWIHGPCLPVVPWHRLFEIVTKESWPGVLRFDWLAAAALGSSRRESWAIVAESRRGGSRVERRPLVTLGVDKMFLSPSESQRRTSPAFLSIFCSPIMECLFSPSHLILPFFLRGR